jgi:hypothetical protein
MSIEPNDLLRYVLFALVIVGLTIAYIYYWRSWRNSPRIFAGALFSKDFYIMFLAIILIIVCVFIAITLDK